MDRRWQNVCDVHVSLSLAESPDLESSEVGSDRHDRHEHHLVRLRVDLVSVEGPRSIDRLSGRQLVDAKSELHSPALASSEVKAVTAVAAPLV